MSTWLVITTASAFGYAVTLIPLAKAFTRAQLLDISREPAAALTVQAAVLWLAGTSQLAAYLSLAAGVAAMWIVMKLRKEDGDDRA